MNGSSANTFAAARTDATASYVFLASRYVYEGDLPALLKGLAAAFGVGVLNYHTKCLNDAACVPIGELPAAARAAADAQVANAKPTSEPKPIKWREWL